MGRDDKRQVSAWHGIAIHYLSILTSKKYGTLAQGLPVIPLVHHPPLSHNTMLIPMA